MTSNAELIEPCPFCGGPAIHWKAGELQDEGIINELAGCYGTGRDKRHPMLRMSIVAWNTRASPASRITALEERIRVLSEENERLSRTVSAGILGDLEGARHDPRACPLNPLAALLPEGTVAAALSAIHKSEPPRPAN